MSADFFEKHKERLDAAAEALVNRGYWSAFPEVPSGKIYGAEAAADGLAAFQARRNQHFALDQPTTGGTIEGETSPYDGPLRTRYPAPDIEALVSAAEHARHPLRDAGINLRVGVCLEILDRLNKRSFELAHAVMHTTGQGFVMAFQAGGPHAQDRALEAVAMAHGLMHRTPASASFAKPVGKDQFERFSKTYTVCGRGIGLVIACSTFPTWNSYGAIFANLACGNPTIIKPHPSAVLPLAITVEVAQDVLRDAGLPAASVLLAVDSAEAPIARDLATHPEIRLIDYTGGNAFADWLQTDARQAQLFAEKAGVNPVFVHSTDNYKAMLRNLAFSLTLYSGQMCTTPQNLHVPTAGVGTDQGIKSPEDFAQDLASAIDKLLADPERACEVLGMINNPATLARINEAEAFGTVVRPSTVIKHPKFAAAEARTPLLLLSDAASPHHRREQFGPITFVVRTEGVDAALAHIGEGVARRGAITAAVYSTNEQVLGKMRETCLDGGVALSENLLGGTFVNQSTAFSDFHATGLNAAANAALTDEAFVASRFAIVQRRSPAAAD